MPSTVFLVFGPQGSGKSTQGERLAAKLNLPFFDTGAELRRLATEPTEIGQHIKAQMSSGGLVDSQYFEQIIAEFVNIHDISRGIVMDGFPRVEEQTWVLEKFAKLHDMKVIGVLIQISDETSRARLQLRAQTEHRQDDTDAIITKRLATYQRETVPVISYLKEHYQLLEIDGEPGVDAVTNKLFQALNLTNG
ncbi:MAG TPA: nucleoside monophosphate kinase [Candidatus Saccharimonadales bacterium]|nr:nucleoside monophosphate kinase [Candidatus Saccharimonadales bacterium]